MLIELHSMGFIGLGHPILFKNMTYQISVCLKSKNESNYVKEANRVIVMYISSVVCSQMKWFGTAQALMQHALIGVLFFSNENLKRKPKECFPAFVDGITSKQVDVD